jgi:hypothetical protein
LSIHSFLSGARWAQRPFTIAEIEEEPENDGEAE